MTIKQRLQSLALKAFGISELAQLWAAGEDMPDKSSSKPSKPYSQVELVFACVNKLISGIQGLPPVISTADEQIVESGPGFDILFNNPNTSWEQFITQTIGHYALTRDVFWIFVDSSLNQTPSEILVVSGSQMYPITDNRRADGLLVGWEFRGIGNQRATYALNEVYQWKNFNPYDRFHGSGPLSAAKLSIDYSYASSLFNTSSLDNGAEPGLLLTTQGNLDKDQMSILRSQFDSRHKGAARAKRTAVLTGGLDAKTLAMNMVDMQIAELSRMSDAKICSAFGVPPGVVGLVTEAQYSHGPAQCDFVFNTLLPLADLFGGNVSTGILNRLEPSKHTAVSIKSSIRHKHKQRTLLTSKCYRRASNRAFTSQSHLFLWLDETDHPTVKDANREEAEKVLKFTEAGVRLNDIIEAHDLPYSQPDWGDDWWIGMGQVPARFTLEAGLEGLTGPSLPEGEPDEGKDVIAEQLMQVRSAIAEYKQQEGLTKADEYRRLRIWQSWVTSWLGLEREYEVAMRKYFLRQQRILIDRLRAAMSEIEGKSVKDTEQVVARVVFDLRLENNKLKVINQTFFGKASELGIRQAVTESSSITGDAVDLAVDQAKRMSWLRSKLAISSHKIVNINRVTQNRIASTITEGLQSGEGLSQLTDRIKTELGSNRHRAQRIARTQTSGAVSTGRHAGMKTAGVELKGWLTARDKDVRDSHRAAESKYAKGIPLDQPFEVGGEYLMYPADPAGSAANIINCRCMQIALASNGKTFDIDYYSGVDFVNYKRTEN